MSNEETGLVIQASQVTELSVDQVKNQVDKIQALMKSVMREDEHYGVIPGTTKPTLMKPGAEKLGFTFRLLPKYAIQRIDLDHNHREYSIVCNLCRPDGTFAGEGVGSCSTMESKYRYRQASRACPKCDAEAIIKGKAEYGGGWICFVKKGGCGAKFADGESLITNQAIGKIENPDIADTYNTVLKMAKKRAHVDAMLTACAASDLFTQDLEDQDRGRQAPAELKKVSKRDEKRQIIIDEIAEVMNHELISELEKEEVRAQIPSAKSYKALSAIRDNWTIKRDQRAVARADAEDAPESIPEDMPIF